MKYCVKLLAVGLGLIALPGLLAAKDDNFHLGNGEATGVGSGQSMPGKPPEAIGFGHVPEDEGDQLPLTCEEAVKRKGAFSTRPPVCGQPVFKCPSNAACAQMMPLPKTYASCDALEDDGAQFLHVGACKDPHKIPRGVAHKLHMGFYVTGHADCVEKITKANELNPAVSSWLSGSNGKELSAEEYCSRLYGEVVVD